MDLFRDPDCSHRLGTSGTVFDTSLRDIRAHLDDTKTLYYMHNSKCERAVFTSGSSFTLSHDPRIEHTCSADTVVLSECVAGKASASYRDSEASRFAIFDLIQEIVPKEG